MKLSSVVKGKYLRIPAQLFSLYYNIGCKIIFISATAFGSLCLLLADGFPGTVCFVGDKV